MVVIVGTTLAGIKNGGYLIIVVGSALQVGDVKHVVVVSHDNCVHALHVDDVCCGDQHWRTQVTSRVNTFDVWI